MVALRPRFFCRFSHQIFLSLSVFTAPLFALEHDVQVIGTLRDQLIYPHSVAQMRALGVTDADLVNLLQVIYEFQFFVRFLFWNLFGFLCIWLVLQF